MLNRDIAMKCCTMENTRGEIPAKIPTREVIQNYFHIPNSNIKEVDMGDKGKKDSVRREGKKKPKLTLKEKRKKKKEKKK